MNLLGVILICVGIWIFRYGRSGCINKKIFDYKLNVTYTGIAAKFFGYFWVLFGIIIFLIGVGILFQ